MSFHFNLSSSSEEESGDEEKKIIQEQFGVGSTTTTTVTAGASGIPGTASTSGNGIGEKAPIPPADAFDWGGRESDQKGSDGDDEEGEDDDDEIDWEDAEDDQGQDGDDSSAKADGAAAAASAASTPSASAATTTSSFKRKMPMQGITIDFGSGDGDEKKDDDDNDDNDDGLKKRRKKTRKLNKIQGLPPHMLRLVQNIHRSHMLCLSSRAMFISSLCSDDELLHLAHSLIPGDLVDMTHASSKIGNPNDPIVPSEDIVRQVLAWFFELVNDVESRRRRIRQENAAMGAPQQQRGRGGSRGGGRGRGGRRGSNGAMKSHGNSRSSSSTYEGAGCADQKRLANLLQYYSPTNDSDPDFIDEEQRNAVGGLATPHEKAQLLVLVCRSLGWRVRYVTAMQPISTELTVNHPLFAGGLKDMFLRVMASGSTRALQKKTKSKTTKKTSGSKDADIIDLAGDSEDDEHKDGNEIGIAGASTHQGNVLGWAEILCSPTANRTKRKSPASSSTSTEPSSSTARWVHADCERKVADQPSVVEKILARLKRGDESGSRTRERVSYVLGVEHNYFTTVAVGGDVHLYCRVTDVTRRYAGAWSQTLRLRGASGQQIVKNGGKCVNSWWDLTLRKVNRLAKRKARIFLEAGGSVEVGKAPGAKRTKASPPKVSSRSASVAKSEDTIVIGDSSDSESEDDRKPAASVSVSSASNLLDEDEHENAEKKELAASAADEAIPTSKSAFKKHPLYALASNLNKTEVIDPAGKKRIVGIFKGELIYRRSDISVALTAKKWLYEGRKVKEAELSKPAKKVKARKKSAPKTFRALTSYGVSDTSEQKVDDDSFVEDDGMDWIYGRWQTEKWSPEPVGPDDEIPVNEYKNVELTLINPGLVHLEVRGIAKVAKKLAIPYAPCLLGFEGHGGNRTPTIRGIVVHEHNADLLRCAYTEWESQAVEQEHAQRRKAIYGRWKRLIVGMLTKERLDRQYGGEENK